MDDLARKIRELITGEDPTRPLTDDQLAAMLGVSRATVTIKRDGLGIPSSRVRRRQGLAWLVHEDLRGGLSSRALARALENKGIKINHTTASKLRGGFRTVPVEAQEIHPAFRFLVGAEGSLRPVIQLAQAAVVYPPRGLNALILGPTGVGKTELAAAMHRYAVEIGTIAREAPFVAMNCADYADNPQLLMAQLFGYVRGAFTGAVDEKPGLVELADGGILFLDEIHRLPPQGQEMLFTILDRGVYRRLGESATERRTSFMLIGATSADPDLSLLEATRRRLPVVISIPPLNKRPLSERISMIKRFFSAESAKISAPIEVAPEVVEALSRYECPGNIGQLKADIQVACARAYLKWTTGKRKAVSVTLKDLPPYVANAYVPLKGGVYGISTYFQRAVVFQPGTETDQEGFLQDEYAFPENLYEWMEKRCSELESDGLKGAELATVISGELERMIARQLRLINDRDNTEVLAIARVANPEILHAVRNAILETMPETAGDSSLVACIAIHLTAALERLQSGKPSSGPVEYIFGSRLSERAREKASRILSKVEETCGLHFPSYESELLAMYVNSLEENRGLGGQKVGIVLMSHGRVASAVRDVVETLLPGVQIHVMEIGLNESTEYGMERALDVLLAADRGYGVIAVSDMGSLTSVGELAAEKAGLRVHTFAPLNTVLVLDLVRRIASGLSLDEVVSQVENDLAGSQGSWASVSVSRANRKVEGAALPGRKIVLVTCITGQGFAVKLKEEIESHLGNGLVEFRPIPAHEAASAVRSYGDSVVAIIGSIDPGIPGIPFLSFAELSRDQGLAKLYRIIRPDAGCELPRSASLCDIATVFCGLDVTDRWEAIGFLCAELERQGKVKPAFHRSVVEREEFYPTYVGNQVAIPHGAEGEVISPAVCIGVLTRPVEWGSHSVRIVFLLALKHDCISLVEEIGTLIRDRDCLERVASASTAGEVLEILRSVSKEVSTK